MEKDFNMDENILLSYRIYGFSKIGFVMTEFIIDDDYNCKVNLLFDQANRVGFASTEEVSLDQEERDLVKNVLDELPSVDDIPYECEEDRYEGFDINYKNSGRVIHIANDICLKRRFDVVKDYIQFNHQEVSLGAICSLYNNLVDNVHENNFCFKKNLRK